MAKATSFAEKAKKKDRVVHEIVKLVTAVRTPTGSWKFQSRIVELTDENRKAIFG